MRSKTIVNGKGEPQATRIEIPIEGGGGALGMQAVTNLTALISGLKNMKTEQEVVTHYHIICGFATCCEVCGFMTEKSTNDLMHMVEHLVENELARVAGNDSP
ncbi:hypothetical protein C810_00401 [Lachnospiraceae bacterium A2]|nr:hypothetical protein C810_00401 [Lachnospiraceae bacterium A2]